MLYYLFYWFVCILFALIYAAINLSIARARTLNASRIAGSVILRPSIYYFVNASIEDSGTVSSLFGFATFLCNFGVGASSDGFILVGCFLTLTVGFGLSVFVSAPIMFTVIINVFFSKEILPSIHRTSYYYHKKLYQEHEYHTLCLLHFYD